jgi:AraC-like DNA-binding protein
MSETIATRIGGASIERPRDEPPAGVPIALRTAQHSHVSRGRFEPSWSKRFVMAKWVVRGRALMRLDGQSVPFGPGQVAIYLPSIPHEFWAIDDVSEMCWFTVDGPVAEQFVMELDLLPGVYPCGQPPLERIKELMQSLTDHTIQGRRHASLLAIRTWYELANSIRSPRSASIPLPGEVVSAQHIIQQELANPDLSTELIAARLNCHRGSLSRLFHKHTGVTVIDYITQVRLQQAKSLLVHTGDSVARIGSKCGFREASYFCRWLRKHTGATPKELRNRPQL